MNLFRSEEHAKKWSSYDPISADSIMPLPDWATVFSGPLFRKRMEHDYLSHLKEYGPEMIIAFQKLGKTGPFWDPHHPG